MVLIRQINVPDVGLVYAANNTQLRIGPVTVGSGTLYINEECLEWMPSDRPVGMSIQWRQISVHGVARDPVKCIYFMIDHNLVWEGVYGDGPMSNGDDGYENSDEESEGELDAEEMTELWLIPEDANVVETIYQAMTDCQALHPDEADSASESDSDYMEMDEDDDDAAGNMGENVPDVNINEERFADADE